jgi:hypothetical protein
MYIETVLLFNKKTRKRVDSSPSPGSADVSSASRIFSHAEARRARREEDWIFSACAAAPREPLYSPSSKWGKLKVEIRKALGALTSSSADANALNRIRFPAKKFVRRDVRRARRARREEDWIFSASPRLRVNLCIPLLQKISCLDLRSV